MFTREEDFCNFGFKVQVLYHLLIFSFQNLLSVLNNIEKLRGWQLCLEGGNVL